MIAADANKSNSITTFDIVELRKLILGIYSELPNNTSWRFVPKEYVFPDSTNPFVPIFPVTITESNLQMSALNEDFVAVKVGDVNGTVVLGLHEDALDRSLRETLWFDIARNGGSQQYNTVQAGELLSLTFTPSTRHAGYQFTLEFKDLEVLDITSGDGLSAENFGVFRDAFTCSFAPESPEQIGAFTVTFRAKANGVLDQMLAVSSRITPAEAYGMEETMFIRNVNARFFGNDPQLQNFELYQNQPNPFSGVTSIPFYLPLADEVRITVFDELGAVLYTHQDNFTAGQNNFELDGNSISGAGILFYKVESSTATGVRKMMRQ